MAVEDEVELFGEVGLDDLFGQPSASPAADREIRSSRGRRMLSRWFLSLAGAAVLYGLMFFIGVTIPFVLVVVIIFVIASLKQVLSTVSARGLPAEITGRGIPPEGYEGSNARTIAQENDGVGIAVGRWAGRLALSGDTSHGQPTATGWLENLVDERLRLRHGFTRGSDPSRAREMMGELSWGMLHSPSTGGPTPRDMAALVKRIGEL